ncbi:MAG: hypothetical protein ACYDDE_00745 [bacterium]
MFKKLKNKVDWKNFKALWQDNADEYEFYNLIKHLIDFKSFDKGWQYRTVLNSNFKEAKNELMNILTGSF